MQPLGGFKWDVCNITGFAFDPSVFRLENNFFYLWSSFEQISVHAVSFANRRKMAANIKRSPRSAAACTAEKVT